MFPNRNHRPSQPRPQGVGGADSEHNRDDRSRAQGSTEGYGDGPQEAASSRDRLARDVGEDEEAKQGPKPMAKGG